MLTKKSPKPVSVKIIKKKYAANFFFQKSKSQHYGVNPFFENLRFGNFFRKVKIGHF